MPRRTRVPLLLASWVAIGCGGHADLGGACDGGARHPANGGTAGAAGTPFDVDGSAGTGGVPSDAGGAPASTGGVPSDAGGTGSTPGRPDASPEGGSGSGGATGDATTDGSATGGAPAAGGASAGGAPPDASTSSGGITGAGGVTTTNCSNGVQDGYETDVDCGGPCEGCGPGKACQADVDCSVYASGCERCMCDADTSSCVHDHCVDHKADVDETDVDCGGSRCSACANGALCRLNSDCVSDACDLATHRCITDQCADHRKDGAESDADCGGGTCAVCPPGRHCSSNFDCVGGHFCNGSHICQ